MSASPNATQLTTLAAIFAEQVSLRGDAPALHFVRDGAAVTRSWSELGSDVYCWASALERFGVARGTHVVQWSGNRFEWVITDLALNCLGVPGAHAGLLTTIGISIVMGCTSSTWCARSVDHRPLLVSWQAGIDILCDGLLIGVHVDDVAQAAEADTEDQVFDT